MERTHKLICDNCSTLNLTGIEKADNATPTHFSCLVNGKTLSIIGKNMTVNKLDIAEGVAEICGEIEEIKYSLPKGKLFKRLFR